MIEHFTAVGTDTFTKAIKQEQIKKALNDKEILIGKVEKSNNFLTFTMSRPAKTPTRTEVGAESIDIIFPKHKREMFLRYSLTPLDEETHLIFLEQGHIVNYSHPPAPRDLLIKLEYLQQYTNLTKEYEDTIDKLLYEYIPTPIEQWEEELDNLINAIPNIKTEKNDQNQRQEKTPEIYNLYNVTTKNSQNS